MDKYEYRVKTEQMLEYVDEKSYKNAMEIADTIDWRKVKNTVMLTTVSDIYENMEEYDKARDLLYIAYDRSPNSKKVVYQMGIVSIKMNDLDAAMDCYEEFVRMAPKDPNQYILRYKILKAEHSGLNQQIEALEAFKKAEYVEKWAYELAELYSQAGMTAECLEECDDLILWFSEGKYVYKAMELKMKYKPLTPLQQEKYQDRDNGLNIATIKKKAIFKKPKERPAPDPRVSQKIRENVHVTGSIDLPELPEPLIDITEQKNEDIPEEHVAPVRPRTKIENTSKISTMISGESLADIIKTGVAVASGKDPETEDKVEEQEVTGQMKIEEILANWEETQKENAKILEKQEVELKKKKAQKKEEKPAQPTIVLSEDVRRLMDELENGEEPEHELVEEQVEKPVEEFEHENMSDVVQALTLTDEARSLTSEVEGDFADGEFEEDFEAKEEEEFEAEEEEKLEAEEEEDLEAEDEEDLEAEVEEDLEAEVEEDLEAEVEEDLEAEEEEELEAEVEEDLEAEDEEDLEAEVEEDLEAEDEEDLEAEEEEDLEAEVEEEFEAEDEEEFEAEDEEDFEAEAAEEFEEELEEELEAEVEAEFEIGYDYDDDIELDIEDAEDLDIYNDVFYDENGNIEYIEDLIGDFDDGDVNAYNIEDEIELALREYESEENKTYADDLEDFEEEYPEENFEEEYPEEDFEEFEEEHSEEDFNDFEDDFEEETYEAPQYEAPQYEAPQYEAPQ